MQLRFVSVALAPCLLLCVPEARAEGLFEGIDAWSRAMVLPANAVWKGPRVPQPSPRLRPPSARRFDSALVPLSVHGAPGVPDTRLRAVLAAGEAALTLWAAHGVFRVHGDAGGGGTSGYDVYVAPTPHDIDSGVDASAPYSELDAARAFALLDTRIGADRIAACTAEALADALLRELDPAERAQPRRASAAYFAGLVTGERSCGAPEPIPGTPPELPSAAGDDAQPAELAPWLRALGARHDQNRGQFVVDVWQLLRQHTWEGEGLRASPSLVEAVEALLRRQDEPLVRALGELASEAGRRSLLDGDGPTALTRVPLGRLPLHAPPTRPLAPLASAYVLVALEGHAPGERISVWLRGEYGVRWVLSALRLDADMAPLGRVDAKVRDTPDDELHVELDERAAFLLVSVTNGSGRRVPSFGPDDAPLVHAAQLTLDRRVGF